MPTGVFFSPVNSAFDAEGVPSFRSLHREAEAIPALQVRQEFPETWCWQDLATEKWGENPVLGHNDFG